MSESTTYISTSLYTMLSFVHVHFYIHQHHPPLATLSIQHSKPSKYRLSLLCISFSYGQINSVLPTHQLFLSPHSHTLSIRTSTVHTVREHRTMWLTHVARSAWNQKSSNVIIKQRTNQVVTHMSGVSLSIIVVRIPDTSLSRSFQH